MAQFANEHRGLAIKGTNFRFHDQGCYAAIFVDCESNKARKVFFKRCDQEELYSKQSFDGEIQAYEIASQARELRDLIPEFFGIRAGIEIVDNEDNDVSDEFLTDLVYEMEFISGNFIKIGTVPVNKDMVKKFRDHGIFGLSDACVLAEGDKIIKIIDFSVSDIEPQREKVL